MRVLLSAYSCRPARGSEPGVGWGWVSALGKTRDLVVLTRSVAAPELEEEARRRQLRVHWRFLDAPVKIPFASSDARTRVEYTRWQAAASKRVRGICEAEGCDIVHHVTMASYWLPCGAASAGRPFIWGPVGGGERAPRHLYRTFGFRGVLFEVARDILRWATRMNPAIRRTARRCSIAFATTPETAGELIRLGARDVRLMSQVALSREEYETLAKAKRRVSEHEIIFISVGRMLHWKGFQLALRAFADFRREHGAGEYLLVGEGPFLPKLAALAEELRISDHVAFLGSLSRPEVFEKLQLGHVFLHPSLHESGGWVVAEAMAAGLPVVALRLGGPAVVVDDRSGVLVDPAPEPDVVAELTSAMRRLAADRILREDMGANARARIRNAFLWDIRAEEMSRAYDELSGVVR